MSTFPFDAACRTVEPELFFPVETPDGRVRPADLARAAAHCSACPVAIECLAFALDTEQGAGVWGGLDTAGRRALART